eukprot:g1029.t1
MKQKLRREEELSELEKTLSSTTLEAKHGLSDVPEQGVSVATAIENETIKKNVTKRKSSREGELAESELSSNVETLKNNGTKQKSSREGELAESEPSGNVLKDSMDEAKNISSDAPEQGVRISVQNVDKSTAKNPMRKHGFKLRPVATAITYEDYFEREQGVKINGSSVELVNPLTKLAIAQGADVSGGVMAHENITHEHLQGHHFHAKAHKHVNKHKTIPCFGFFYENDEAAKQRSACVSSLYSHYVRSERKERIIIFFCEFIRASLRFTYPVLVGSALRVHFEGRGQYGHTGRFGIAVILLLCVALDHFASTVKDKAVHYGSLHLGHQLRQALIHSVHNPVKQRGGGQSPHKQKGKLVKRYGAGNDPHHLFASVVYIEEYVFKHFAQKIHGFVGTVLCLAAIYFLNYVILGQIALGTIIGMLLVAYVYSRSVIIPHLRLSKTQHSHHEKIHKHGQIDETEAQILHLRSHMIRNTMRYGHSFAVFAMATVLISSVCLFYYFGVKLTSENELHGNHVLTWAMIYFFYMLHFLNILSEGLDSCQQKEAHIVRVNVTIRRHPSAHRIAKHGLDYYPEKEDHEREASSEVGGGSLRITGYLVTLLGLCFSGVIVTLTVPDVRNTLFCSNFKLNAEFYKVENVKAFVTFTCNGRTEGKLDMGFCGKEAVHQEFSVFSMCTPAFSSNDIIDKCAEICVESYLLSGSYKKGDFMEVSACLDEASIDKSAIPGFHGVSRNCI